MISTEKAVAWSLKTMMATSGFSASIHFLEGS